MNKETTNEIRQDLNSKPDWYKRVVKLADHAGATNRIPKSKLKKWAEAAREKGLDEEFIAFTILLKLENMPQAELEKRLNLAASTASLTKLHQQQAKLYADMIRWAIGNDAYALYVDHQLQASKRKR
jgi:hypothetical protein